MKSDSGFLEFHQTGVDGGPYVPCRNLEGTKHGKNRGCKTRKEEVEERDQ